ncbi:membrane protein [soil metagenome]
MAQPPYQPPYGAMDPYYRQFAPKPGCIPLRPLNLGDILEGSFRVIRRNPRTTLGLSAGFAIVQAAILAVFQIVGFGQVSRAVHTTAAGTTRIDAGRFATGYLTFSAGLLIGTLFAAVLSGMLTVVVTEDVLGRSLSLAGVWARTRERLWRLIALSIIVGIVPVVGLLFCLAPGVWLWGIWTVAIPALMVENTTIRGSLGRSRALVRGTFWRILGIRALGVLIVSVIAGVIGIPFSLIGNAVSGVNTLAPDAASRLDVPVVAVLISAIGSIIAGTLSAPARAALDALLYVDLRMRREGLHIALQQVVTGHYIAPPPPPPPAGPWGEYGRYTGP